MGYFTGYPEAARRAFNRLCGLHRAAYWRELGFPNLVRARTAWARIGEQRRKQEAARLFSPYAIKGERYADPVQPGRKRR